MSDLDLFVWGDGAQLDSDHPVSFSIQPKYIATISSFLGAYKDRI